VVGNLEAGPLRKALRDAHLDECRGDRLERVEVQFHVHTELGLAAPAPNNPGDADVARCVANRVKEQRPKWPQGASGILFVEVTLPPADVLGDGLPAR
jgi:hypothetical protein